MAGHFLRVEFHLPDVAGQLGSPGHAFETAVAAPLGAQFRLRDASAPYRAALFVSRYDHCLLDLLWRERRGELPIQTVQEVSNLPDLRADVASFGVRYEHIAGSRVVKAAAGLRRGRPVRAGQAAGREADRRNCSLRD